MIPPKIAGKFDAPKPWQIGVLGAVLFGLWVASPYIKQAMVAKKKEVVAQVSRQTQSGERWVPVSFPAQKPVGPTPMPQPPAALLPLLNLPQTPSPTKPAAVTTAAKAAEKDDPEQDAINSPIMMTSATGAGGAPTPPTHVAASRGEEAGGSGGTAMAGLLKPTELSGFKATVMKHPSMTIEQGRVIQCDSVTRMTSGLLGFVQARVLYDQWSADDSTILVEHDSTMFGEIGHGMVNGVDRMFVLWRQLRTPKPNLVRITLNSPAADEVGEAGITGEVDDHLWKKVKGAVLLSGVDMLASGLTGALSNLGRGNGNTQQQGLNLNFNQAGSQGSNLASQMLQSQITIPDTLTVKQGTACSAFLSGDLDFSGVYNIIHKDAGR